MFKRYFYLDGDTYLLYSDNKYLINNDGQIKDSSGVNIPVHLDENGYKIVSCVSWDGEKEYRVIDLVALQFKNLHIPKEDYSAVVAFAINGNKEDTRAVNVGYRFKGGKLECAKMPGFYFIPGFTNCLINIYGEIFSLVSNKFRILKKTPSRKHERGGYFVTNAIFNGVGRVSLSLHRALCLVFKDYPDNVDDMTVNHIDGSAENNSLDNLEWNTVRENTIHAYVNGLNGKTTPVLSRDARTGVVEEHYSACHCARNLGISFNAMAYRLYLADFSKVFHDGTQVKLKSDTRDWIIPENVDQEIVNNLLKIPLFTRNSRTKEVTYCSSISEASKLSKVVMPTIKHRLHKRLNTPIHGYQFKRLEDNSPWEDYPENIIEASFWLFSSKISARNLLTGEEKTYESTRSARDELCENSIYTRLTTEKQPIFATGWQVKYERESWLEIENLEEKIYKLQKDIMARNEKTGEIIISRGAKKMSELLNISRHAIKKAAYTRGNLIYCGYRFRLGVSNDPWPIIRNS